MNKLAIWKVYKRVQGPMCGKPPENKSEIDEGSFEHWLSRGIGSGQSAMEEDHLKQSLKNPC